MGHPAGVRALDTPTTIGLGQSVHSPPQRIAAVAICVSLTGVLVLAGSFGSVAGPEVKPFLPMIATVWALADFTTAFLLLAQFYVTGTTSFTLIAAAYLLSGLLAGPYLVAFPGLFSRGPGSVADQQISAWIWSVWHATFPVIVAVSVLRDPKLALRTFSLTAARNYVLATVVVTGFVAAIVTALMFDERAALPTVFVNGRFTPAFILVVAPAIATLNIFGCCLLLRRRSAMTTLQLWLVVAMFTAMLDGLLLTMSPSRYTYGWYIGKVETLMTASVVLGVLLCEVTGLYRRLAEMATIDTLTQLFNRRALEDRMRLLLGYAKRQPFGLGLLIVDVDLFKGFNDNYGHANGDECLRRIAVLLKSAASRPLDLTARYGGDEFVILVPETTREGAVAVAQRVLARVEGAAIPYAACGRGHVTVSAGLSYVPDADGADADMLFELADRALYEAKASGRNTFVVKDFEVVATNIVNLRRSNKRKLFGT